MGTKAVDINEYFIISESTPDEEHTKEPPKIDDTNAFRSSLGR